MVSNERPKVPVVALIQFAWTGLFMFYSHLWLYPLLGLALLERIYHIECFRVVFFPTRLRFMVALVEVGCTLGAQAK